jgi:hypothetical protein
MRCECTASARGYGPLTTTSSITPCLPASSTRVNRSSLYGCEEIRHGGQKQLRPAAAAVLGLRAPPKFRPATSWLPGDSIHSRCDGCVTACPQPPDQESPFCTPSRKGDRVYATHHTCLCIAAEHSLTACHRGTSLIRNTPPAGPYSSPMPRDLW